MAIKFKDGQHIYVYDSNGAHTHRGRKNIPFKYENDYAVKEDCVEADDSVR